MIVKDASATGAIMAWWCPRSNAFAWSAIRKKRARILHPIVL
jgi:hypothetical protein